jgi:hypothetical protein
VFEQNRRAIRFYVRRGWRPTGEKSRSMSSARLVPCRCQQPAGSAPTSSRRRCRPTRPQLRRGAREGSVPTRIPVLPTTSDVRTRIR